MRRGLLVVPLLVLGMQAAPRAELPTTCGGTWLQQNKCEIRFNGFPLTVKAIAFIAGEPVTGVMVSLEGPQPPAECGQELCGAILLACGEAHTAGDKGCERSVGPSVPIPLGNTLTCRVRGLTSGTYTCSSGP